MAKRTSRALGPCTRAGAVAAGLLLLIAANAAADSLRGSVGGAAKFPARSLVLSAPAGVPVSVPRIYVTENGEPVDHLSVTPMTAPGAGDFGIVLVIDQSQSMSGVPLARAMAAARALAARRTGNQELGVITFDSRPSVVLPMTSDPGTIRQALAATPWTGVGASPLAAVMAGLGQLAYAHIADGAVVVLSDGADTGASKLTAQSVGAAAGGQHARIFTVGVRDRSFTPDLMRQLARLGGGRFVAATGARLPRVATHLATGLAQSYLLRYQSILPGAQQVAVTVHVDGMPRLLRLSYDAPAVKSAGTTSGATPVATSGTPASGGATPGTNTSGTATPGTTTSGTATSGTGTSGTGTSGTGTSGNTASSTTSSGSATARATSAAAKSPALPSWWSTLTTPSSSPHYWKAIGEAPTILRAPSAAASARVLPLPQPISGYVPPRKHQSFWSSSLAVLLIAGGCALLLGLAIMVLLLRRPARRALQRRVGSFTLTASTPPTSAPLETAGPFAQLLTRRRWWPAFAERVQTARMKRSPLELAKRSAVISVVAAFVLGLVTGSILPAMLLLLAAPFIVRTLVARGARRQRSRFNEQLPSHLQDLAGAMRAGRSFVGAISGMIDSAAEPIRGEFERALSDERLGLPLEETLEAVGRRMAAKDMEQVALIASLNRKSGSNVAEAIERVAESARERADLNREMRSLTGQARLSAYVLTGMPPVLLLALTFLAPQYQKPLFHTTMGIVLLFFAAGMLGAGWMVMNKIVNPAK